MRILISLIFPLLILLATSVSQAEGPAFQNKDTFIQQEFDNVYKDLRNVNQRLTGYLLNVKDYGVKCDGTTDDASAIQAVFNSAKAGDTIIFPRAGTCIFTGPLKWPNVDNVGIIGYGATLKLKNGANSDLIYNYNYPSSGGGNNLTIVGLTIDGNRTNNSGNGSMILYGVNGGSLTNMMVKNGGGVGFFFIQASTWIVTSCNAINNQASGFCAYNGCSNIEFHGCHAIANAPNFLLQGLEVDGQSKSYNLRIISGSAIGALIGQSGIQVFDGVEGFIINGVTIANNTGRGVDVYSGTTTALSPVNTFPNKNGVISNCDIYNNSAAEGIKIWDDGYGSGRGPMHIGITNNIIHDQSNGLVIQSSADFVTASGNDISRNSNQNLTVGSSSNSDGFIQFNLGQTSGLQTRTVILADKSTTTFLNTGNPIAMVHLISDAGYMCGFAARGGFNTTALAYDASAQCSTTASTANKTNVWFSGGLNSYQLENETGATRTYTMFYMTP